MADKVSFRFDLERLEKLIFSYRSLTFFWNAILGHLLAQTKAHFTDIGNILASSTEKVEDLENIFLSN